MRNFSFSDWLPIIVHSRLETLREFGTDVERMSANEKNSFEAHIVANSKTIEDEETRGEYLEFHAETYHMYESSYPQLSRELVWVKANFILESGLHEAVEWIEEKKTPTSSYSAFKKTLRGKLSDIGVLLSYIDKIAGVRCPCPDLSSADPDGQNRGAIWNDIETIRVVRNAICHNDGVVDPTAIPAVSSLGKLLSLDSENRITFPAPVHDDVVRVVGQVFDYLEKSLYPSSSNP